MTESSGHFGPSGRRSINSVFIFCQEAAKNIKCSEDYPEPQVPSGIALSLSSSSPSSLTFAGIDAVPRMTPVLLSEGSSGLFRGFPQPPGRPSEPRGGFLWQTVALQTSLAFVPAPPGRPAELFVFPSF
ncbi:hypothetical protein CRENBAI_020081 [Crenichthys baileyi]|uniref:Uncharacterized protein n=1 Tax=Crenichthys baileyi TaxID=28760 RepID=A0AAV9RIC5_9TELE